MTFGAFGRTFGAFDRASAAAAESTLWDDLIEYIPLSESSAGSGPVERAGSYLGTRWTDAANAASDTGLVHASAAGTYYVWRTKDGFAATDPDVEVVA